MKLKESLVVEGGTVLLSVKKEVGGNHPQSPGTDYLWYEQPSTLVSFAH